MVSIETLNYLNSRCRLSDALYDQGGLIYLYTFGYHRAHTFIDREVIRKVTAQRVFDDKEIDTIRLFFESALVQVNPKSLTPSTLEFTNNFLNHLVNDFKNIYCYISNFENDEISKILTLTFIENNDFHSLELFWSID